ncbi:maleylpyruvate isomerase family mycothiol-dependent enzyme [Phycicoccus sp. HDW14]|nr:maleylpyruvate isomerase family mycothiol-dependent enzyme [Phycicoccus sp. HDW14]
MATWAQEAGLDAPVPTCPGWTVHDLLAHQGRVHRWALAALSGADLATVDIDDLDGPDGDAVAWLRAGAAELLDVLRAAPDDLVAPTFLKESPAPRMFWARRQHHEATIHALDALAARDSRDPRHGRAPTPDDAWFDDATAVDGIDELLVGFWQRRTNGPRAEADPYTAVVAADSGARWLLDVGTGRVTTRRLPPDGPHPEAAAVLSGPATDLYLALWNRGGAPHDPDGLLARWSHPGRIT